MITLTQKMTILIHITASILSTFVLAADIVRRLPPLHDNTPPPLSLSPVYEIVLTSGVVTYFCGYLRGNRNPSRLFEVRDRMERFRGSARGQQWRPDHRHKVYRLASYRNH